MKYYLMGIGGTGMSSLAFMLTDSGHVVSGSDSGVYPPVSLMLEERNIKYFSEYTESNLEAFQPDMVIVGNVISRGNPEIEYVLRNKIPFCSMPEAIKEEYLRGTKSVVVAGTHGKTTTTSLITHILEESGLAPGFMIGGKPGNFATSGRIPGKSRLFVIEGDEYDSSLFDKRAKFFHYLPDIMVINNLEFDHGDIYEDLNQIKKAFRLATRQIPDNGFLIVNGDDENIAAILPNCFGKIIRFGMLPHNDVVIENLETESGKMGMSFQLTQKSGVCKKWIPIPGEFNVRNATVGIIIAQILGVSDKIVDKALASFKNTTRRMEEKSTNSSVRVFEDFAHHPTAIHENLKALKTIFPGRKLIVAYEPRSNTSVRRFHQDRMAWAFEQADETVIADLHRVSEIPENDRLDVGKIVDEIKEKGREANFLPDRMILKKFLKRNNLEDSVIVCMSQGDFGGLSGELAAYYDSLFTKS